MKLQEHRDDMCSSGINTIIPDRYELAFYLVSFCEMLFKANCPRACGTANPFMTRSQIGIIIYVVNAGIVIPISALWDNIEYGIAGI